MLPFMHLFAMKTELAFCAFLALALSAAVSAQPMRDENSAGPKNAVVLIIRHAEDADSGKGLSPLGTTRADGYANYFKNFTVDGKPLKLNYIFATRDSRNSHRPRLTSRPPKNSASPSTADLRTNSSWSWWTKSRSCRQTRTF
jgi:hypothetical protein